MDVKRRTVLVVAGASALTVNLPRVVRAAGSPADLASKPTPHLILAGAPTMDSHLAKTIYATADVGLAVDLAVSTSPDMSSARRVGVQTIDADRITTHPITGLSAATRYYGRLVVPATGVYFGEQFSFTTAPPLSGSWTRKVAVVSCQGNEGSGATNPQAWQDISDWGADAIWHLGDFEYWGQDIADTDPYSRDISMYAQSAQARPIMRGVLQSRSLDVVCISDHEIHANGDRWQLGTRPDTFGCLHSVRELLAFQALMPVATYWDTRSPRKHRGYHFDLGTTVRVLVTDLRTPERNLPNDPDTPEKQLWGAAQEASLFAALDPTRVNIIVNETSWWWWGSPTGAPDKPASYPDAQQRLIDKVNATGPDAGGPVHQVAWVGGDRHYVGYLSAADNTHGGWPCHISSGVDKYALPLQGGENPTWQHGGGLRTVQTVTLTGAARTFTLSYSGEITTPIRARASSSKVRAALEGLSNISPGDVVVSGPRGGPWEVRFGGLLNTNVVMLTGHAKGGTVTLEHEKAPVVGYLQMTLSYDAATGGVALSTKGRAVLDTSGPAKDWVIGDIPAGVAVNTWTP